MNNVRVSILASLLFPSLVAAQGLPGQLPGQALPGQLPGSPSKPAPAAPMPAKPAIAAPMQAKPATTAPPATAASPAVAARPLPSCCSITEINKAMGFVHAREKVGGRTIEIKASAAQMQNLQVGQDVFANLDTRKASLDGKTVCCDLTIVPLPSVKTIAASLPAAGKIDKVSGVPAETIQVAEFSYQAVNSSGTTQGYGSGTFSGINLGQSITLYAKLRNTGTATLNNVQWKIHKVSGPGQFDSGVQTLTVLPPTPNGYAPASLKWTLQEGSHRFVAIIDPNSQVAETAEMRRNNSVNLDVTVGPLMTMRALDPKEAGAPGAVAVNLQDTNGCTTQVLVNTTGVNVQLSAPYPYPIPFPGCSVKPEFYKGIQLKNGWRVHRVDLSDVIGGTPKAPADSWGSVTNPEGTSLYAQTFITIPARASPCTGSSPCRSAMVIGLSIQLVGRAGTKPF